MDFPLQLPGSSGLPVPGVVIRILCNYLGHLVRQFLAWRGVRVRAPVHNRLDMNRTHGNTRFPFVCVQHLA